MQVACRCNSGIFFGKFGGGLGTNFGILGTGSFEDGPTRYLKCRSAFENWRSLAGSNPIVQRLIRGIKCGIFDGRFKNDRVDQGYLTCSLSWIILSHIKHILEI